MVQSKLCSACQEEKALAEFFKNHAKKDGLQAICKACAGAYQAAYYEKNKDAYAVANAAWRAANKERESAMRRAHYAANRERIKAEMAAVYAANGPKIRARMNAFAAAHPEVIKARSAAYYSKNSDKVLAANARNRAKRQKAQGSYTAADVADLMRRQRGQCVACRRNIREQFHVDHIDALVNGGTNDRSNLQLLCPRCNLQKQAKHPVDFMQTKGFLL